MQTPTPTGCERGALTTAQDERDPRGPDCTTHPELYDGLRQFQVRFRV